MNDIMDGNNDIMNGINDIMNDIMDGINDIMNDIMDGINDIMKDIVHCHYISKAGHRAAVLKIRKHKTEALTSVV